MFSLNDIINVSFRKSGFAGYRAEDVDAFIDRVRESYDELQKKGIEKDEQIERLKAEAHQADEKLKILAGKIEEYRSQEDEIKNALISAQRLGEASMREARHKGEIILKDASLKADRIIATADEKVRAQQAELDRLQKAVSDFRAKLLSAYKEHLTLIDALPAAKAEPVREIAAASEQSAEAQPVTETAEEAATEAAEPQAEFGPAPEEAAEPVEVFQAEISYFDEEAAQGVTPRE